ncbi:oxidoreductase [Moorella sp. E308F]|uniref:4Fe-4S dicluster domain-containing protein n=1 Tax=Moorella sp. E308F TaxID=2572682 RepID=UPI0010FFC2D6|nr:4Fe-4S dicluster domain-containing protein [Moorella sp. E308F]GEA16167.1 oxidoreductase [Moorella sp. E308F]
MKQRAFALRLERCVGCRNCQLACKNEHRTASRINWRQVREGEEDGRRYYVSLACNHCRNPECFRVCPEKAYWKRRDGLVLHLPRRCQGCQACVQACPYQAPRYNPETRQAEKCNFCLARLDEGLQPACVAACPTGALNMMTWESDPGEAPYSQWVAFLPDPALTLPSLQINRSGESRHYWQQVQQEEVCNFYKITADSLEIIQKRLKKKDRQGEAGRKRGAKDGECKWIF